MEGKTQQSKFKFMTEAQVNAKRKSNEEWDSYKEIILEQYLDLNHTLEEVRQYMKDNHDFDATKRQYIHRVGEIWGVKKYKTNGTDRTVGEDDKGESSQSSTRGKSRGAKSGRRSQKRELSAPNGQQGQGQPTEAPTLDATEEQLYFYDDHEAISPFSPNMNYPNTAFWYSLQADTYHAVGDLQSAFQIYTSLYRSHDEVSRAIACARSAQVKKHINDVRIIIEQAINTSGADEFSWTKFLFSAQLARNYEQAGDTYNAFEQFGDLLERYIDLRTSRFHRSLITRGHKLDIIAYIYLRHAIKCFNDDDLNFQEGEEELKEGELLQQFMRQQPAYHGDQFQLSCLRSCLVWCVRVLEENQTTPRDPQDSTRDSVSSLYKVICLLFKTWVQGLRPPEISPAWASQSVGELSIPAPELLSLVVCTIMATPLPNKGINARQYANYDSAIADALHRARALNDVSPIELLNRFKLQIEQTADRRMVAWERPQTRVRQIDFDAIRKVLRESMPVYIEMPHAHNGYIYPLAAEAPIKNEAVSQRTSAVLSPSPSTYNNFISAQHGGRY